MSEKLFLCTVRCQLELHFICETRNLNGFTHFYTFVILLHCPVIQVTDISTIVTWQQQNQQGCHNIQAGLLVCGGKRPSLLIV